MNATDFLLCLIDASGGTLYGRTLLQKRAYFVTQLLHEDFGLGFGAHYYGPYSATVEGTAAQLKNLGFLQESSTAFGTVRDGFEVRRYNYSLTADGKTLVDHLKRTPDYQRIVEATRKIVDAGDPNYVELSIAAKAYFLLKRKHVAMTPAELVQQAEQYNWRISSSSVQKAVAFLSALGLVQESSVKKHYPPRR